MILRSLPKETDRRVEAIIDEFRKLNHTVDECEIGCLLMLELVTIGKPPVLPLCREFESTSEQRMMRRLAFALRAIGDPRAVPTLIRVLPILSPMHATSLEWRASRRKADSSVVCFLASQRSRPPYLPMNPIFESPMSMENLRKISWPDCHGRPIIDDA